MIAASELMAACEAAMMPVLAIDSNTNITFPEGVTLDQLGATMLLVSRTVEAFAATKQICDERVEAWFDRVTKDGFDTGLGFKIATDLDSATSLGMYLQSKSQALITDLVYVTGTDGIMHEITVGQFATLAGPYTTEVERVRGIWGQAKSMIRSATTFAALQQVLNLIGGE